MSIRLVSWDVDGTLYSSFRLKLWLLGAARQNILRVHRFHRCVEAQRRNPNCKADANELLQFTDIQAREREWILAALTNLRPRPSAIDLLQRFASAGIPQVALSDFECGYKLEALGLDSYFLKTYSCQQLGFWKPSAIPLAHIQRELGIQPHEHLHIGDRPDTDGESCSRNGCQFLLL